MKTDSWQRMSERGRHTARQPGWEKSCSLSEAEGKPQPAVRRVGVTESWAACARLSPGRGTGAPSPCGPGCSTSSAPRPSQVPSAGLPDKIPGSNRTFCNQATFKRLPETYNLHIRQCIYLLFLGHKRRNGPAKTLSCKSKI